MALCRGCFNLNVAGVHGSPRTHCLLSEQFVIVLSRLKRNALEIIETWFLRLMI